MREIRAEQITEAVAELCVRANRVLPEDIVCAIRRSREEEHWQSAADLLDILVRNEQAARESNLPICQDTGMAVVFADIGQEVHITGSLEDAVNAGVRQGYTEGLLRKSVVADPLRRVNTGDNTPAVLHVRLVPGDRIHLTVAPKGFGSENMSRVAMLPPARGIEGVRRFVVETVLSAGANPCPPMVLGVGIGSDFEGVTELAKRALMLPVDGRSEDPFYAALEEELLELVNSTGIGPQGLGGRTTCLGIRILAAPTHIASLPVAVNVSCHVTRHQSVIL